MTIESIVHNTYWAREQTQLISVSYFIWYLVRAHT